MDMFQGFPLIFIITLIMGFLPPSLGQSLELTICIESQAAKCFFSSSKVVNDDLKRRGDFYEKPSGDQ